MIRHCVMVSLRPDANPADVEKTMKGLADLVDHLEGCSGFVCGNNRDYEQKSVGTDYGFTLDAKDAAALSEYANHPTHKTLGAGLVALCQEGADGITVYDLEINK